MKGYKVLYRNFGGSLESATSCAERHEYPQNEMIRPKHGCGPFAVFGQLHHAERFRQSNNPTHLEVWRCTYEPSNEKKMYRPAPFTIADTEFLTLNSAPEGTKLASSITITERVV
jgi:hypothetical protein